MRKISSIIMGGALAVALAVGALVAAPSAAYAALAGAGGGGAESGGESVDLYRLYNPYTGEHFYTPDTNERDSLVKVGWKYEGVGWSAVTDEGDPVYRLYNPYAPGGDHHYTIDKNEYDELQKLGWKGEGSSWESVTAHDMMGYRVYRLYNPNAATGAHHYTTDADEAKALAAAGWKDEGTGWFASGQRRFLLDGTQPEPVENARVFLGVPNDPSITYSVLTMYHYGISHIASAPTDGLGELTAVTFYINFWSDAREQNASVYMNQDGTVYTGASASKWNGDIVSWSEDGTMSVFNPSAS